MADVLLARLQGGHRDLQALVPRDGDVGAHLHDGVERDRTGFLARGDVDLGWRDGIQVGLTQRLRVVGGERLPQCLLARHPLADARLEHPPRGLPGPEARDADLSRDLAEGGLEGTVELLLVDLDGQLDPVALQGLHDRLHRTCGQLTGGSAKSRRSWLPVRPGPSGQRHTGVAGKAVPPAPIETGSGAAVAHLLWGQAVGGSNPPSPTATVQPARGCSSVVELQPSKLATRVQFPSPALSRSRRRAGAGRRASPTSRRPGPTLLLPSKCVSTASGCRRPPAVERGCHPGHDFDPHDDGDDHRGAVGHRPRRRRCSPLPLPRAGQVLRSSCCEPGSG